jgi:hypothetical protein
MPVEFIKQLHQDSLEKAWNARPARPPADPMLKRRRNVLSRIDVALAQLESGEINPPRGSYHTRDNFNGVRVQLKYGQRALAIDGRDHWFVEDAASFFRSAREAVERGELDAAIIDAIGGKDEAKDEAKASAKPRDEVPPVPKSKPPAPGNIYTLNVAPEGKAKDSRPAPKSKPLEPGKVYSLGSAPDGEASASASANAGASEPRPARPGKFAQKYEKLLAAGVFNEPTA